MVAGGVLVITPSAGLRSVDTPLTLESFSMFARVPIAVDNASYREPLVRGARALDRREAGPVSGGQGKSPAKARAAARLAAVQALYQMDMEGTPLARLLHEFHQHRLGATIEDATYADAEQGFFDDIVSGVVARRSELDLLIEAKLSEGWSLERLDRPMRALLLAGAYELVARPDVPVATVINEYLDVAEAFYDKREKGFANGLLDSIAKDVRR